MAEYNLKNIRKDFKLKGIFYTPEKLAIYLKSLFPHPEEIKEIYDPTCGSGNLLSVFDDNVVKYGQDINVEQLEEAKKRLKNFHGEAGDTLQDPKFMGKKFDFIVANYPFSIKWKPLEKDERFQKAPTIPTAGKSDYAFLLHILYYLSEKGIAITLNFPGILYRGNREKEIRKWMIQQNYIEKVIQIERNTFADTSIATCVIVFNKAKQNKEILFVDGEKQRSVSLEEIAENDYNLSVSNYIEQENTKEKIDILKLNAEIEEITKREKELRNEIDDIIAEIEGDKNKKEKIIKEKILFLVKVLLDNDRVTIAKLCEQFKYKKDKENEVVLCHADIYDNEIKMDIYTCMFDFSISLDYDENRLPF